MATIVESGLHRTAVLLVSLGSDLAAPLLRGLRQEQIEAVTREIVRMSEVSEQEKVRVMRACFDAITSRPGHSPGAGFARDLLAKTLGERKADQLVARAAEDRGDHFAFIRRLDTATVVAYLETEHPQTVAIALAHMPSDLAAQILSGLSLELQADAAQRVVRMGKTDPDIVAQVAAAMRARLAVSTTEGLRSSGGMDYLIEVLAGCDSRTERSILEALESTDPDLARSIRDRMFTFEDVASLDDRSIQRVLREVDLPDLAIALRGATPDMQHAFYRNMSSRTAQLLRDEMERIGPVRVRAIEDAQRKIVAAARELLEADEIVVTRGRQDVFV